MSDQYGSKHDFWIELTTSKVYLEKLMDHLHPSKSKTVIIDFY